MLENTKREILFVETERLKISEKDNFTEDLHAIFIDTKTMYYYPQFLAGAQMGIDKLFHLLDHAGIYIYPLVLKETGRAIGFVTLNNIEESCKRIEIGFFLISSCWKNGYAREILNEVVVFLKKMGWHRIEATVYSGNEASQKVLESCGFILEGVLRDKYLIHGEYHDDIIYSIINPLS